MADQPHYAYLKQFSLKTALHPQQRVQVVTLATLPLLRADSALDVQAFTTDLERWSDDGGHGRAPDPVRQPAQPAPSFAGIEGLI